MGEEGEGEEYRKGERKPERRGRKSRRVLKGTDPSSGRGPASQGSVDDRRADRVVTEFRYYVRAWVSY